MIHRIAIVIFVVFILKIFWYNTRERTTRKYLFTAVTARVCKDTAHMKRIQNPWNWQVKLLNGHFPVMREATENGIPNTDIKKSETAKDIMYMLGIVLRRFGFLMTAIPSNRFPRKETRLIINRKKDSTVWTTVVRLFNCWAKTSIVVAVTFMMPRLSYADNGILCRNVRQTESDIDIDRFWINFNFREPIEFMKPGLSALIRSSALSVSYRQILTVLLVGDTQTKITYNETENIGTFS